MFKDNLKRILNAEGMKQKELAKKVGVSPQSVSAWIKGERYPRMQMLNKVSEVLQCPITELTEVYQPKLHQEIIWCLNRLTERQKEELLSYAKYLMSRDKDA